MSTRYHYIPRIEWDKPKSAVLCGAKGTGTNNMAEVTCPVCRDMITMGKSKPDLIHHKRKPNLEPHMPYRCGAMTGEASVDESWVNCSDCIDLLKGGNTSSPLHVPPNMNENNDGIFTFHDRNLGGGYTMEVVPQTTGNVEITIEDVSMNGPVFTLSHTDRADLLRALLHDFHYSPERGGPNDDIN